MNQLLSALCPAFFAKTKRVRLTNEVKLKVIERVGEKRSHRQVAEEFGISRTQVTRIFQNKENILRAVSSQQVSLTSKVSKMTAKYPDVDRETYEWFVKVRHPTGRCKPLPVTSAALKMRALQISLRLGISNFQASNGWFSRWRNRFSVGKSVRLHGEASDVDINAAEKPMNDLREKLRDFKPENIFNMDETGLFFRALPNR
jgi:AcrR family transcriptional regulator